MVSPTSSRNTGSKSPVASPSRAYQTLIPLLAVTGMRVGETIRLDRNARLAAIHSLFRYAALRHPEHAELIQRVLAIPPKRFDRALISFRDGIRNGLGKEEGPATAQSPDIAA